MDEGKKNLEGSPSRDRFKLKHKLMCPKTYYAADLDLVLVAKYPNRVVAYLDYKGKRDRITFSEVILYNQLKGSWPVYIVKSGDPDNGPFEVWQYLDGDPKPEPPVVNLSRVAECKGWLELGKWEKGIRTNG